MISSPGSLLLSSISSVYDNWIQLPANGKSGGILIGCDGSKFLIENQVINRFSITIFVKNRIDNQRWCLTVVYAPINMSLKKLCWEELEQIGALCYDAWLICGDFAYGRSWGR